MLANVINIKSCDVPISRLNDGNYIFGTKKIHVKIMNNKLVVRVGGGFRNMDDFITTYAESERQRIERMDPAEIERIHLGINDSRKTLAQVPLSNR